ncbi:hypothetical protein ACROYT_G031226 [Oculina patagonica]
MQMVVEMLSNNPIETIEPEAFRLSENLKMYVEFPNIWIDSVSYNCPSQGSRRLIINNRLEDGTTQGDPLDMSLDAISFEAFINRLQISSAAKLCWFAYDATGSGSFEDLKKWWGELLESGLGLGYFPNAKSAG